MYAYIARSQNNEAIVEEKQKREEINEGTSTKRVTRGTRRKEAKQSHGASPQDIPPPGVSMEEVPKEKKHESSKGKSKPLTYKLQSDIELATDVKKVLEERILNSKVEFTLGEVLGSAKREFHEDIIDIIKRKRQVLREPTKLPSNEEGETLTS